MKNVKFRVEKLIDRLILIPSMPITLTMAIKNDYQFLCYQNNIQNLRALEKKLLYLISAYNVSRI